MSYIESIRARVGKRKIFLVFSSVVLEDRWGRVLLQQRADFGFWGLPGGVLEVGEDIRSCAHRELEEETGLRAGRLRLVGIYTDPRYDVSYPNGDQAQQFTVCFAGRVAGGHMKPDGVETLAQRFYEPDQLQAVDTPVWYRDMIRDALTGGQPAFAAPFIARQVEDQFLFSSAEAGAFPYITVGAIAAVVREDRRLLAVRSADGGRWSLPEGKALLGENAAHTAQRRTRELAGLAVVPDRLIGIYSSRWLREGSPAGQPQEVGAVFRARTADNLPRAALAGPVDWIPPEQLLAQAETGSASLLGEIISHLNEGYFVS